jgi:hypothetical protein
VSGITFAPMFNFSMLQWWALRVHASRRELSCLRMLRAQVEHERHLYPLEECDGRKWDHVCACTQDERDVVVGVVVEACGYRK